MSVKTTTHGDASIDFGGIHLLQVVQQGESHGELVRLLLLGEVDGRIPNCFKFPLSPHMKVVRAAARLPNSL